ncbi:MAG: tryptophan--tRNA ligase [Spirochaetaceae bacterium]|nr:tryptophan--tRNA ligase [Spirochaetaceae bacterium]|tara:strand:- start:9896 stop:10864 length:969 start_codon:yes stop_codon:yes gene_type:complete
MRVLSGIQPSGQLHLGNYFSMMRQMIHYQDTEDLFCFVASYHALTTVFEKDKLEEGIRNAVLDFLALGMDPEKSTFWVQSDVPEVVELSWLLSTSITVPQLELGHSYKDKVAQGISPSGGLFFYPILMAADILAFGSEKVPVGKDQKQHLEFARDIAGRFNNRYGDVFVMPEPEIGDEVAVVPGVDGRKMSKSYGNAIYFFAPEKKLRKAVMGIVTDSTGVDEPKDPEGSVLYQIYCLFLNETERQELADRFRTPGTGYGHFKQELFERIMETFSAARQKREQLAADPGFLKDVMQKGAEKARGVASKHLDQAREAVGLKYL